MNSLIRVYKVLENSEDALWKFSERMSGIFSPFFFFVVFILRNFQKRDSFFFLSKIAGGFRQTSDSVFAFF